MQTMYHLFVLAFIFLLAFGLVLSNRCNQRVQRRQTDNIELGEPLFLTPLITNGKLDEARQAAMVNNAHFLGLQSYSGFLTVKQEYNSNLFFWYFPTQANPEIAPLILWLEGGPGDSSLYGLFTENGPLQITPNRTLGLRNATWLEYYSLLYIDSPIGAGFSFTECEAGYARNQEQVSQDLYEALDQLYKLFPEFIHLRFYIAGNSYAGKFIPSLAYKIHSTKETNIKLAGLIIGNGLSDPITQIAYGENLYNMGLIDDDGWETFQIYENQLDACIRNSDMTCVKVILAIQSASVEGNAEGTVFGNLTGFENLYNLLVSDNSSKPLALDGFIQNPCVRNAIHVGNRTFYDNPAQSKVVTHLVDDFIKSVRHLVEKLLEHYRICVFHGQLDLLLPYKLTVKYLQELQFSGAQEYKTAKRQIWRVADDVAGYVKKGGNLTEVFVRNAGHYAVADQPTWILDMVKKFVNNENFDS